MTSIHELHTEQLTLSDDLLARYQLEATALTLSGTCKQLGDEWRALEEGLEPGDRVAVSVLAVVDWIGTDGKTLKLKLDLETVSGIQRVTR